MATITKVCKICGKSYKACCNRNPSESLRWQDVACCKEHAEQYFYAIALSRGEAQKPSLQEVPSELDEQDMVSESYEPEE